MLAIAFAVLVAVVRPSEGRAGVGADDLVYVALGDSYTAGPLVLPHDTTWVPQDCGQSIVNYPHLAARAIGATSFKDASCTGATLDDLYAPQSGLSLGA